MQVDRQRSSWPYIAMLLGLMLFCLMAPRYWYGGDGPDANALSLALSPRIGDVGLALPFGWEDHQRRMARLLSPLQRDAPFYLFGPPTIEELIATHRGMHQYPERPFGWAPMAPAATLPSGGAASYQAIAGAPNPLFVFLFEKLGRAMVVYGPMPVVALTGTRVAEWHTWWSSRDAIVRKPLPPAPTAMNRAAAPSLSSLRLVSPQDRLAMLRPIEKPAPRNNEPAASPQDRVLEGVEDPWCVPQVLLDQLERLACHPMSADWANETIDQLHRLTARSRLEGAGVRPILESLSELAHEALRLAEMAEDDRLRVALLRAHWGLARRLDCWAAMLDIRIAQLSRQRLAMHGSLGSFFDSAPRQENHGVRASAFSADLEDYEKSRDPHLGRLVVQQKQTLEASPDALDRSLADSVEQHYRNANVRIALTAELLNRLVAGERFEVAALRDRIAGTPVRGRSFTNSDSRVRLDPAEGHWQVTIESQGVVNSNSVADGGQAQLRSRSETEFTAAKSVLVDGNGVRLDDSLVGARNHSRLVGVTTDYDWVPLFGSYARDRAVEQYQARRARAQAEVEYKVASRAASQIDQATQEAVARVERQIRELFTDRLAEGGVDLTPIEMTTSSERLVGRFRVAGLHQPASHTPRPRALSDSVASVQVHETALTNAAVTLSLDGGRFTAPELQQLFRDKFPGLRNGDATSRRETIFHFALEDALQIHIEDGRLELTLSLQSLEQDRREIRNFIVHAYYVPAIDGLEVELVRNGALGIEGRLSSGDRARLHNVFNSVLPPDRRLPILRLDDPNDPRLEGLMVTQLVLEDGWLGLSIGPTAAERVAERSRSLR